MRHRAPTPTGHARPRTANPGARPGLSTGGPPPGGRVRGGQPDQGFAEYPPTRFDGRIHRERGPWFHTGNYIPAAEPLRWTDAGPLRADMHMATHQWRRGSGGSHSDRTGWHTHLPRPASSGRGQQSHRAQSRIANNIYDGQSYSDTTVPLLRRGKR